MSLVNDTVATLAACRYQDQDTMLGVILGTGSNGAYVECSERVHNASKKLPPGKNMIINCEWGNFTTAALPMIDEDRGIDTDSVNPDNQHFEKMTAGKSLVNVGFRISLDCCTCSNAPVQVVKDRSCFLAQPLKPHMHRSPLTQHSHSLVKAFVKAVLGSMIFPLCLCIGLFQSYSLL